MASAGFLTQRKATLPDRRMASQFKHSVVNCLPSFRARQLESTAARASFFCALLPAPRARRLDVVRLPSNLTSFPLASLPGVRSRTRGFSVRFQRIQAGFPRFDDACRRPEAARIRRERRPDQSDAIGRCADGAVVDHLFDDRLQRVEQAH